MSLCQGRSRRSWGVQELPGVPGCPGGSVLLPQLHTGSLPVSYTFPRKPGRVGNTGSWEVLEQVCHCLGAEHEGFPVQDGLTLKVLKRGALRYQGHKEKPQGVNPGEIKWWMGSPQAQHCHQGGEGLGDNDIMEEGHPASKTPIPTPRGCQGTTLLSFTHRRVWGRFGALRFSSTDTGQSQAWASPISPHTPSLMSRWIF